MISLVAIIGSYLCAILAGKLLGPRGVRLFTVLVIIAIVQVVLVLVAMFSMNPPQVTKDLSQVW